MKVYTYSIRAIVATIMSAALFAVVVGTASAATTTATTALHAKVLSATPAIGSTIAQSPTTVTVVCAENINPNPKLSNLYIYSPAGDLISQGDAKIPLSTPKDMSIGLKPTGDGVYVVQWKTVSADDGDPDQGAFVFTVKANAVVTTSTVAPAKPAATTTATASSNSGFPVGPVVLTGIIALLVGLGAGFGIGRNRPASAPASVPSASAPEEEEAPSHKP